MFINGAGRISVAPPEGFPAGDREFFTIPVAVVDTNGDAQVDRFFCNRAIPRTDPLVGGQSSLPLRGGAR